MTAPALFWFRNDLRLADNPALAAAIEGNRPVLLLYVLDESGEWPPGGAARWWLHGSLEALAADVAQLGGKLVLRQGDAREIVPALVREAGVEAVFWNRCWDPASVSRDTALKAALKAFGVTVRSFNGSLLQDPASFRAYGVFTPFWKACSAVSPSDPIPAPARLVMPEILPASDRLADWGLRPTRPDWAGGLRETWQPGEAAARRRFDAFLETSLKHYAADRNRPDKEGSSRLSPHLRWGEISPRQIWHGTPLDRDGRPAGAAAAKFLAELGWREFSWHLLFHNPTLPDRPLRPEFARFPWQPDEQALRRWQKGETGYPVVDAGMRQLWRTGWMHNRVRMISASFLIKHLLQPWQHGERWFWDTLVDADLASNAASWQWVAGSGADAAPYFRIFNPILQGRKFDPGGDYVRRWVPELRDRPDGVIHEPVDEPHRGYPTAMIDHLHARQRALDAFARIKSPA
jgi:deoxyribodipyrimidine photo-lyase